MKEKINQKGFIQIPILIGIIISIITISGAGYGVFEYNKTSNLLKEAGQLAKEEKYSEANDKLGVASNGVLVKTLSIKKQEINNQIEENKKSAEDKLSYNQGLDAISSNNFQGAIDILSALPESSSYYQKAQTKIEESKRMIVEGKLSKETTDKLAAQAKAKQEEYQKNLKTQELADKAAVEKMMNADNDGDGLTYKREQELGTSDFNKDSDFDGITDNLDAHPAGGSRNDAQYFSWNYQNTNWTWTLSVPEDQFLYYKNLPRIPHGASYVTYGEESIKSIAKNLKDTAATKGYHEVSFAVSFIQGLPYVADYHTGYDEYPKYPLETLIDRNGDCEDTSYLAAAITEAMGIDTVLIILPGHMAIGLWTDPKQSGTYYEIEGRRYYYFETTAEGWNLGDIPDEFRYTPAKIITIPSNKIYTNIAPQYVKPCYISTDFSGYYTDGKNFYTDSQCSNLTNCLSYEELYYNPQLKSFYWDGSCSQIVVKGCSRSSSYFGYFTNGLDYYYDSRCTQKATVCRPSPNYSDTYYNGYNEFWDSDCNQRVVSWCPKSIYYPGYFFNSIDGKIYIDSDCTIKK